MAYKRKTRDVYHILVNYGQGWEHECTELTRADKKQTVKDYRENCPQYPVKTRFTREPIEA